jgi:hypothetical protein
MARYKIIYKFDDDGDRMYYVYKDNWCIGVFEWKWCARRRIRRVIKQCNIKPQVILDIQEPPQEQ